MKFTSLKDTYELGPVLRGVAEPRALVTLDAVPAQAVAEVAMAV